MTKHRTEIVPVTPQMYVDFIGERPKVTVRAVVAIRDNRIIGMAGVFVDKRNARLSMFSHLTDEIRKDRRTIARGIRSVMKIAKSLRLPIQAVADETVEGSEKLLEHMGFEKTIGGVYIWHS
jgi:hypothetical protein